MGLKVIVAGTPRTGTSFMTSIVEALGFSTGPDKALKKGDVNNPNGYFENEEIMGLEVEIMRKLGLQFGKPGPLPKNWDLKVLYEMAKIKKLIEEYDIEVVKATRGWVLADVWHDMYPNVKWIYTLRDAKETHRSRFGGIIDYEDWLWLSTDRNRMFNESVPGPNALRVVYDSWPQSFEETIQVVARHIGVELTDKKIDRVKRLWKPRKKSE